MDWSEDDYRGMAQRISDIFFSSSPFVGKAQKEDKDAFRRLMMLFLIDIHDSGISDLQDVYVYYSHEHLRDTTCVLRTQKPEDVLAYINSPSITVKIGGYAGPMYIASTIAAWRLENGR